MNNKEYGKTIIAKKINNNQDLFTIYSLEMQYPGIKGGIKWAVATDLSYEELEACVGDELGIFKPYIIITLEQGKVFEESERARRKLMMQDFRHMDMTIYEDGMEVNMGVREYIHGLFSEIDSDDALNIFIIKAALRQLPSLLQRRMRLFFIYGFTEKEIAEIEGVSQPAVHYSLQSGIKQIRYMLKV